MRRRDAAIAVAVLVIGWLGLRGARVPVLGLVDLGFHELGHLLAYALDALLPWPEVFTALAGSVVQILVPVVLAVYFLRDRRDRVGGAFCLAWAATSSHDVARYAADAPTEDLQLIGGEHDWAFILERHLDRAADVAYGFRTLGFLLFGAAVVVALWPLLIGAPQPQVARAVRR